MQHLNLSCQERLGGGVELSLRDDAPPVELGESRGLGAYLRMRAGQVPHQRDGVTHVTQLLKEKGEQNNNNRLRTPKDVSLKEFK